MRIINEKDNFVPSIFMTKYNQNRLQNIRILQPKSIRFVQFGLDEEFEWGKRVTALRRAYKGEGGYKITEQERAEAEQLGLIKTLNSQDIGKASFDAPVEKCDEAQAVLDRFVEREQEGEIGKSE